MSYLYLLLRYGHIIVPASLYLYFTVAPDNRRTAANCQPILGTATEAENKRTILPYSRLNHSARPFPPPHTSEEPQLPPT